MDAIVFKAYLINKLTYWFFPIIVVVLAGIYLKLNLTDENRTMACGVAIGIGFIVIFYLNRFEPKLMKFDRENIEISYIVNQWPYGRKKRTYSKNELKVLKKSDLLILSSDAGIVAKMRRKALDVKDWETLENYFD
ncbi:MAG: hypothetical protein NVSMB24_16350 [Mucilaginibacter sp.]